MAAAVAEFGSSGAEKLADSQAKKEDRLRAPLEVIMRRTGRMFWLHLAIAGLQLLRELVASHGLGRVAMPVDNPPFRWRGTASSTCA